MSMILILLSQLLFVPDVWADLECHPDADRVYVSITQEGKYQMCRSYQLGSNPKDWPLEPDSCCRPADMKTIFVFRYFGHNDSPFCYEVDVETMGKKWSTTYMDHSRCKDNHKKGDNQQVPKYELRLFSFSSKRYDCYRIITLPDGKKQESIVEDRYCQDKLIHYIADFDPVSGRYLRCYKYTRYMRLDLKPKREVTLDQFCRPTMPLIFKFLPGNYGGMECFEVDAISGGHRYRNLVDRIHCERIKSSINNSSRDVLGPESILPVVELPPNPYGDGANR